MPEIRLSRFVFSYANMLHMRRTLLVSPQSYQHNTNIPKYRDTDTPEALERFLQRPTRAGAGDVFFMFFSCACACASACVLNASIAPWRRNCVRSRSRPDCRRTTCTQSSSSSVCREYYYSVGTAMLCFSMVKTGKLFVVRLYVMYYMW